MFTRSRAASRIRRHVAAAASVAILFESAGTGAQSKVILREGFGYPAGDLLGRVNPDTSTAWTASNGAGLTPITVTAGSSLAVTGLSGQIDGYAASTHGTGTREDLGLDFSASVISGESLFYSVLLRVDSVTGTAGDHCVLICSPGSTSTDFRARLFVRQGSAAGTYNVGLRFATSDTVQWDAVNRANGSSVFVIGSYDVVAGAANDTARMWITSDVSTLPATPVSPTLTANYDTGELTTFGRVCIRQGTAVTATLALDELRVGKNWSDVASGVVPVNMSWFTAE